MTDSPPFDPETLLDAMGPLLGIPVDPAFRPGVVANLTLIATMAGVMAPTGLGQQRYWPLPG